MPKPTETPEQISQREYRERTKNVSADRLVPYEIYRLRLAIEAHSANVGKWLSAVALAASTPNDNSAEVQKQIDQFTSQLKTGTDELDAAVKANQPTKET